MAARGGGRRDNAAARLCFARAAAAWRIADRENIAYGARIAYAAFNAWRLVTLMAREIRVYEPEI